MVKDEQGNAGTQTIAFSFSEEVTSMSGATTTTCGSVAGTTFGGNTVILQLGTLTLRIGDVNADGSVNQCGP